MARKPVVIADRCCPSVTDAPLTATEAATLTQGFAALADPVRLRIVSMLGQATEVCACDFVEPLERSQPTISHHLKVLTEAGIISGEKRGRWVWYSLDRQRLASLAAALSS
jgi:ArsR family transcriptional regulator